MMIMIYSWQPKNIQWKHIAIGYNKCSYLWVCINSATPARCKKPVAGRHADAILANKVPNTKHSKIHWRGNVKAFWVGRVGVKKKSKLASRMWRHHNCSIMMYCKLGLDATGILLAFLLRMSKIHLTPSRECKGNRELKIYKGSQPTESKVKVQSNLLCKNLV